MEESITYRKINWHGPLSWPGYEGENELSSIPYASGVYLFTFEYGEGFLIYAAGITRRSFPDRFKEHTRSYLNGDYNVLDIDKINNGKRQVLWKGWSHARKHRDEFEANAEHYREAIDNQLKHFRIFIADIHPEERVHERIEAAIMNSLYLQLAPICEIPDRGMQLSPRWKDEIPILIRNLCSSNLYGFHEYLEI